MEKRRTIKIKLPKKPSISNTSNKTNFGWPFTIICYTCTIMFRIIILVAIFLAVYPMIGTGYDQFTSDFNINGVGNFVSNIINGFADLIDNFKS